MTELKDGYHHISHPMLFYDVFASTPKGWSLNLFYLNLGELVFASTNRPLWKWCGLAF